MRICLTGTHGVGKSTILEALKEKLPEYDLQIESLTRKAVGGDSSKVNMNTVDDTERKIAELYMESFLKAPANFVASRHMVDVLAYSMYLKRVNKNISSETIVDIETKISQVIESKIFDLVVYIPVEFELKEAETKFREGQSDKEYQKEVDKNIRLLLYTYDIKYITLMGSVEDRVKQLLTYIK